MPKQATGELRILADGFAALITIKGRDRRQFLLPTCATKEEARARCAALAGFAARLRKSGHVADIEDLLATGAKVRAGKPWEFVCGAVDALCAGFEPPRPGTEVPTLAKWAEDWTSGRLAAKYPDHVRKKRSSDRDEQLVRNYVVPQLPEGLRVDRFELEHAEHVMASLPAHLSPGTRGLVAHVMARLMRLAVYPGKWRKDNPIPPGWMPRKGAQKAKECLYPDEDALLLGGVSREPGRPDVPVLRRLAYGFLAREGMRTDEMASLRWRDVDLERGRVTLDTNKTDDPRDWDLRPDVREALTRWKARQPCTEPGDHVFAEAGIPLHVKHLADLLRGDLRRVGVTRPQLFERSEVRQPLRAHDLRATFVTIGLATGKTETWISDRTGHQSHKMIDAYRRKARTWNMGELGPLHDLIPELAGAPVGGLSGPIATGLPLKPPPHGKSSHVEPEVHCEAAPADSRAIEKTRGAADPSRPDSPRVEPAPWQSIGNQPSDEDLERGILDAVRLGLADVARTLAAQLEDRRRARAPKNVVPIEGARSRGRR